MIAVDSSALLAIALVEPEARQFAEALASGPFYVGWPTLLEVHFVLRSRRARSTAEFFDQIFAAPTANPVAFDKAHHFWAQSAFDKFGKGNGHPAQLNFGDCMAYAVAKELDAPILFKGADFSKTDLPIHEASVIL